MTQQYKSVGKRKTAIARVYLSEGTGKITVNNRTLEEYFGRPTSRMIVEQPLKMLDLVGKLDIKVNVVGGGLTGQAGAIRHGITRALMNYSGDLRATLKAAGFVTRDSRKKERKIYGQKGARARFQFSKR